MSLLGSATRTAGRLSPWARMIAAAEIALLLKRHVDKLGTGELTEMRKLLAKSKGRPGNLTATERKRLAELVRKVEPALLVRTGARSAMPFRKKR